MMAGNGKLGTRTVKPPNRFPAFPWLHGLTGNRKAQATAEFLLAFAVFLAFISIIIAGITGLEKSERGLALSVSERMEAEETASALGAGCWAGRVSAEIPLHMVAGDGKVVVGNSSGRIISECGGINGEPI
ncbi:MAG: hypothetical protein AB1657_00200 [Candidatus Micrarchaeota archaeon]